MNKQNISMAEKCRTWMRKKRKDIFITLGCLALAVIVCWLTGAIAIHEEYIAMIFLLAVSMIARFTDGYLWGILSSLIAVFLVNVVFTYPYMKFDMSLTGYPLTFACMLAVSLTTSTMTSQIKEQEKIHTAVENERVRGNLLRAISHDLRTPLTSIIGASGALAEDTGQLETGEVTELAKGIHEDAQWLLRMVENLLSITRIDGNVGSLHKEAEAAEEVIAAALQRVQKLHTGYSIHVSAPEELLMVPMDAMLIEQVLINLMENAIRHGKKVNNIHMRVEKVTRDEKERDLQKDSGMEEALFTVEDDGCGIPQEYLEHLFDGTLAWKRTDSTRGMGIGLSVCKSIVTAHGGRMWAENKVEGGAVFHFTLPLEDDRNE